MKLLRDRSFLFLVVFNLVLIVYYINNPGAFKTLVWIYWFQSVVLGISTFIRLRQVKDFSGETLTVNGEEVTNNNTKRNFSSIFFMFHYGMFHFVYLIFLFVILPRDQVVDMRFLSIAVLLFCVDQTLEGIRRMRLEEEKKIAPGVIFFMPYMRVAPMHLTILLPQFFVFMGPMLIFLVLKAIADVGMYLVARRVYGDAGNDNINLVK
jgi:hypothetical protein